MIYQFDGFQLDVSKFELRRNGEVLSIGPQVFDFLYFIIKNSNRLVSRDEVIDEVWEGRSVSDTTVSSCVKAARKVLGDDGGQQRYIRTARGRGFQFIYDVKVIDHPKNETKDFFSKKTIFAMVMLAVTFAIGLYIFNQADGPIETNDDSVKMDASLSTTPYTIAVLPFEDMSVDGDQEYFGRGVAEEILNVLTGIKDLDVMSRTTAFSIKGQNLSIPQISEKLGVKYIVEGSVRKSGNRIRITAQLINAETDVHIWSENYDRELVDIFAIQDEIGLAIADVLQIELAGGEFGREAPTQNMEAYALYLQGHQLFLDRGAGVDPSRAGNLRRGIALLERAVALDPNFAEAWADVASSNIVLPTYLDDDYSVDVVAPSVIDAANRAISLNPELSQAWAVKGFIQLNQFQFQDAELALTRAVELNPKNDTAWLWLALHFATVGNHTKAYDAVREAIEISPDVTINYGVLGMVLHGRGDIIDAIGVLDQAIKERGFEAGRADRALLGIWENDMERAREEIAVFSKRYKQSGGEALNEEMNAYMNAYIDPSLRDAAYATLEKNMQQRTEYSTFFGAYMLRDGEKIVQFFETTPVNKTFNLRRIYNPLVRPIFKQEIFRTYLIKIGLLDYWRNNGFPSFCRAVGSDDFMCE